VRSFLLFLLGLLMAVNALAASDPKATVQSMIVDFKSDPGLASMLKYVHWPSAYAKMTDADRKQMGISSPESLKQITEEFLSNPSKALEHRLGKQMGSLPTEQQAMLKQMVEQQRQAMEEKLKEASDKMKRATYEIGEVKVNGNQASVALTATLDQEVEKQVIKLELIDDKWYLPSSNIPGIQSKSVSRP